MTIKAMPDLPRPGKKNYKPRRDDRKPTSDQSFYQSTTWRKARIGYIIGQPLCEVSAAAGLVVPAEVVDHIIPISVGGSKLDPRNFMSLSKAIHDYKSSLESHRSPLVAWDYGNDLEKIPENREKIIELLIKKAQ